MNNKIGRNDPCSCGSGKKYKQCCMLKNAPGKKRKLTAKWINAPKAPDLMNRTYGAAIASSGKIFSPISSDTQADEVNDLPRDSENAS